MKLFYTENIILNYSPESFHGALLIKKNLALTENL